MLRTQHFVFRRHINRQLREGFPIGRWWGSLRCTRLLWMVFWKLSYHECRFILEVQVYWCISTSCIWWWCKNARRSDWSSIPACCAWAARSLRLVCCCWLEEWGVFNVFLDDLLPLLGVELRALNQARSVLEFFLLRHDERVLIVGLFHCWLDLIEFSDSVVNLPNVA